MTFPFDGELIYLTIQDEEAAAAKTQFEAKAAVDIQRWGAFVLSIREEFNSKSSVANFKYKPFFRKLLGLLTCYFTKCIYYRIFRGYVARNVYKKLLRDERERLEDERKAAVEIQRYNLDCYSYAQEDRKIYCIHMDLREITFKFVAFYSVITGDTGVISSGKRRFISKQVLRRNTWSGHLISSK